MSTQAEYISPSTKWQALVGCLPYFIYGIASMLTKLESPWHIRGYDADMVFYALALFGFLIGWIQRFPMWSYSYLGWSILIAYFHTDWGRYRPADFQVWIPFGIMVLIALLWTRSFAPIQKLFRDIWHDWTRLSLVMFTFGGFIGLIYDENHHPQLFWFMLATTLAVSSGIWLFLRSSSIQKRIFFLIGSFGVMWIISMINEATWDFHAYHGLTPTVRSWYQSLWVSLQIVTFWVVFLFWPVLIGGLRKMIKKRLKN